MDDQNAPAQGSSITPESEGLNLPPGLELLEKLGGGGASMSGINSHGGNLTINLKGLATVGNTADRIDVLIWHDSILNISDGSCSVAF